MTDLFQRIGGPVAGNLPCGKDLTLLPPYLQVKALFDPKYAGKYRQDDFPPYRDYGLHDWTRLAEMCCSFMEGNQFRGLELGLLMSYAALKGTEGLEGWNKTLILLNAWIQSDLIWDALHPQDPKRRIALIKLFSAEYHNEGAARFIKTLQDWPLSDAPHPAPSSNFEFIYGDKAAVQANILSSSPEYHQRLNHSLIECEKAFNELCSSLSKRFAGQDQHTEAVELIRSNVAGPSDGSGETGISVIRRRIAPAGAQPLQLGDRSLPGKSALVSQVMTSGVTQKASASRGEAIATLDAVIDFFSRRQPSSPMLPLISRARGLVGASLDQIIKNLFDDASLKQAEKKLGSGWPKIPAVEPTGITVSPIGSASEVVEKVTEVINFFTREEPTSPVPFLLEKALKLSDCDFQKAIETLLGVERFETLSK